MAKSPAPARPNVRTALRALVVAALVLGTGGIWAAAIPSASAASTATVRLRIDKIDSAGCSDFEDGADYFANLTMDGVRNRYPASGYIDNDDHPSPGWSISGTVDLNATTSLPHFEIELWEWDSGLNGGDDLCDINPAAGATTLSFDLLDALPCMIGNGVPQGQCLSRISTGNGEADGNAQVTFTVEVDPPASGSGLAIRCLPTPLWPQPGQNVTITAESLDGNLQVGDTVVDTSNGAGSPTTLVDRTKIADSMEIWTADANGVRTRIADTTDKSILTATVPSAAAGDLTYDCIAKQGSDLAFTGWRKTRVGAPAEGKAIPVLYTGGRASRVDIVLIPDSMSYTSASSPTWIANAGSALKGSYQGQDYFLANQQWFNIWLADALGTSTGLSADSKSCGLTTPGNWDDDYSWRDAGAILHTAEFRDCASGGVFSTEFGSVATMLHETGHAPFGLADEYSGDGGYFSNGPNPNLYTSLASCQSDAPNLGRPASACRSITQTTVQPNMAWFLSDPAANDLMNTRRPPNGSDIRRMNWFIANCQTGGC